MAGWILLAACAGMMAAAILIRTETTSLLGNLHFWAILTWFAGWIIAAAFLARKKTPWTVALMSSYLIADMGFSHWVGHLH